MSHRLGCVRHHNVVTRPKNVTTNQSEWLAERFEAHRNRLRAVAYRMLGSLSEADDESREPGYDSPAPIWWRRKSGRMADDGRRAGVP